MKEREIILTVYEERSFSKAAKRLFVSQPALSMAVKKIENELGITVFDRASLPLTLTDAGRVYIDALEEMRSIENTMKEQLSDIADLSAGHVTVSGENFVSSFILPEVLMEFTKQYGGIRVELVESNSPDLKKLLLSESIDLLVAHDTDSMLYDSRELFEEEVILAVPENNPMNEELSDFALSPEDIRSDRFRKNFAVDLGKFANEEFLLLKKGNDMQSRAENICAEAGFSPRVKIRLDQLITSYKLTAAGMGLSFVTDVLVKKSAVGGCVYYRIDSAFVHRKMCIVYKKHRYLSRAAAAFIETACKVYDEKNL